MLDVFARAHELGLGPSPAALSEVYRLIAREQFTQLVPVLETLAGQKLPVVVIKGADLDLTVYQQAFPRVMGDIDVLVRPTDVAEVSKVFRQHGFMHGTLDKDRVEMTPLSEEKKLAFEEDSIELAEFAKLVSVPELLPFRPEIECRLSYWRMAPLQDAYSLVVGYDVHTCLSLEFEQNEAWDNLRSFDYPGFGPCLGQSYTDMAWYLAVRFYHELHINCSFVMRGFLDVLAIVWRHHSAIDWERLVHVARKYQLQPALYYTFWHVHELLGALMPRSVVAALAPNLGAGKRSRDWGDFMAKFLGDVQCYPLFAVDRLALAGTEIKRNAPEERAE